MGNTDKTMNEVAAALRTLKASRAAWPSPVDEAVNSSSTPTVQSSNVPRVIGIDGRVFFFGPSMERGIGHYTINHLKEIFKQRPHWRFVFFLEDYLEREPLASLLKLPNTSWCRFDDPPPEDLALFHIPDSLSIMPAFDSPFRVAPKVPISVLFLDLIPLVMHEKHFDVWAPLTQVAYRSRLRQLRDQSSIILSISESSKRDLIRLGGVAEEKIVSVMAGLNFQSDRPEVTPQAQQQTLQKYGLKQPFFMTVGALDSHKNFPATVNAFMIAQQTTPMQLAVVGGNADPYKGMYKEVIATQNIQGIVFTGYVPDEDLNCLYAMASALIFPSLYEGFGFPVLEAMANGCPAIASNTSSIPEVAGDAGILVNPTDSEAIARGMLSIVQNPELRAELSARGIRQAARFTWADTARKTIENWELLIAKSATAGVDHVAKS